MGVTWHHHWTHSLANVSETPFGFLGSSNPIFNIFAFSAALSSAGPLYLPISLLLTKPCWENPYTFSFSEWTWMTFAPSSWHQSHCLFCATDTLLLLWHWARPLFLCVVPFPGLICVHLHLSSSMPLLCHATKSLVYSAVQDQIK